MGVEHDFFFKILYPLQDNVLRLVRELDTGLYLTGGTAASRGYLGHRFSDDLDLFASDQPLFPLWVERVIQKLGDDQAWTLEVLQRDERFVRLSLAAGEAHLRVEFVNDVPAHVGEIREHETLGRLDSPENILANKVSALIDRDEPKDLADIWGFGSRMKLPLSVAIESAQSKAAGVFPADLARLLCTATEEDWKVVRWIDSPEVGRYLADLKELGNQLLFSH